jgi:uncharacterized membrane protein YphA (DoxX/SURF4 family)
MQTQNSSYRYAQFARIALGLIYFVFGLNFFFHFIPGSGQPEGRAAAFIGGLFQSGYLFPLLKVVEVVSGSMLILGFFTPLILVVLMPITLNILLFHTVLAAGGFPTGLSIFMMLAHVFLAWSYREHYKHLFTLKPAL